MENLSYFKQFPTALRKELTAHSSIKVYGKNDVVFVQDDVAREEMYVIMEGSVVICSQNTGGVDHDDHELRNFGSIKAILERGSCFGEDAIAFSTCKRLLGHNQSSPSIHWCAPRPAILQFKPILLDLGSF